MAKAKLKLFLTGTLMILLFSCSGNMKKYDMIIAEIKKHTLPIGKLERYKLKDFSNISSLKKMSDDYIIERGNGAGCIWSFKTKENLLIFIELQDKGHGGEYGIAYSENGQIPIWKHDEWGELWETGNKINNHWWDISFRLN
jgi:hypothetical protein